MQGREAIRLHQQIAHNPPPLPPPFKGEAWKECPKGYTHVTDRRVSSGPNLRWRQSNLHINVRLLKKRFVPTLHVEFWELTTVRSSLSLQIVGNSRVKWLCGVWERDWAWVWLQPRKPQSSHSQEDCGTATTAVWPMAWTAIAGMMRDRPHLFHSYFRSLNEK